ncbi:MAG: amidohydrolase [Clostridia bacterium]|nr:amidohydrolase [Clostridia bacterium]
MKYLFKNANILSGEEIVFGNVVVDENKIVYVGKNLPNEKKFDEVIDVNKNLLMSGFINAHCHTPSTVLRGISDDKPLEEWLEDIIPKERALSDDDIYWSTMLGIMEYVRGGITGVEEDFGRLVPVVKAHKTSGLRARISIGFPNVAQKKEDMPLDKQLEVVQEAGLSAVCFAHSVYGTSEENFEKLITFAAKNGLPVSTHMSETLTEVGDCTVKNNDLSPPQLLEDYGFFDRQATVFHAVHCDKDDLDILANYDINIVSCPASNLKLASGIAPIYAASQKGINVALGTDGAYSNNSYDMFKEMFLAATLNKAALYKADILPAHKVVQMATKNGAKALGFENVGDIKEGNFADLILVDLTGVHHQPVNNIISNLVYSAKSTDVYLTMVNGKILYHNGKYNIGESPEKIYEKVTKMKNKLNKR